MAAMTIKFIPSSTHDGGLYHWDGTSSLNKYNGTVLLHLPLFAFDDINLRA
jgi:hypothetical protein